MRDRLRELVAVFGRLGLTAFGGPAVHIAMMEDEVVTRRHWLSREAFLDLLGATNLIPGPNSTEMAIHLGYLRAGWAGLVVAGLAFILPAAACVAVLAWAYTRWGYLPAADRVLYGLRPVVIAIVLGALVKLGRSALKSWSLAAVAAVALALTLFGAPELGVLFGGGALAAGVHLARRKRSLTSLWPAWPSLAMVSGAPTLGGLFLVFAKIGAVLFGSGYVLVAFMRHDLVDRLHWLTDRQLLDAVTAGQITPGPLFTTATFVGWIIAGPRGAAAATAGIFLPAFAFVALSGPLVPRLRRSAAAGAFLDGLNAASLALLAAVALQLGHAAIVDGATACLAFGAALLLATFPRLGSVWLLVAGAVAGTLLAPG